MKDYGQVKPILIYFLISLSTLTETAYSSSLPLIAEQLNTEGGIAQLSTTTYYLGFSLGILMLGGVSDVFGRRPVVLFGLVLYIISTLLISFSTHITFFIIMRFCQAYGASVSSVMSQSMARDSYRGKGLSHIYANVSMVMSVVPSVGSLIGGAITEYYQDWKYIFYFLILFSSSLLLVYIRFLPETNPSIGTTSGNRFFNVLASIFKDKIVLSFALIIGMYNGLCFGFYIQAPFVFIENLGMHAADYSWLFLILSIATFFGSTLSKYLLKKLFDTYKIKAIGLGFSCVGCISLLLGSYLFDRNNSLKFNAMIIFIPIAIHFIGHALIIPMILRNALENYRKVTGAAGAVFGFLYYMVTAAITFCISLLHSNTINNYAYLYVLFLSISVVLFFFVHRWKRLEELVVSLDRNSNL